MKILLCLFVFISFDTHADILCLSSLGKDDLEVRIFDGFVGQSAVITRGSTELQYTRKEVDVYSIESPRAVRYMNREGSFILNMNKSFSSSPELGKYLRATLLFEDILINVRCYLE